VLRNKKVKTIRDLQQQLKNVGASKSEINDVVMKGLVMGAISITKETLAFEESIIKLDKDKLNSFEKEEKEHVPRPVAMITSNLVATLPFRMSIHVINTTSTLATFRQLIESAGEELIIVSPFLEREGVQALLSSFIAAKRNGTKVRLLTRGIVSLNQALALRDMFLIFSDKISVRAFHAKAAEGYQQQVESTHAKIVLSDRKDVYLGSAEIRSNALFNNFEIGIRTTDPVMITNILSIFDLVWNDTLSCHPITKEEVESKISSGLGQ
jgi:phosphatidylserine/phosphatidylglycerophosphate/cardiolipin synthase-like enzyme